MRREDEAASPAAGRGRGNTLEPGQILAGRYEVTGYIGSGGMGAVYSAKHARTGRELAVKVLLPDLAKREDLMQRFMAEARAAGALNHPGIVEVVDLDHDGDLHFIVMERLEGEELQARMRREHPLDPAFVARVGADLADAIACAHSHTPKIIHRDLKPQNVLLARKGRQRDVVKILDFGIAKLVDADLEHSLTRSGEIYGTPLYMSPEQLRSPRDVDERTDIYSIGVILFHALAGVPPFKGESFPDLVIAIGTEKHAPLRSLRPDVPSGLAAVVEKAMARDKQDRYAFAGQLRDALLPFAGARAAVDSDAVAVTRPLAPTLTRSPQGGPRPRRRRGLMLAVAALIAAGVAWGVRQQRKSVQWPGQVATPAAPLPDQAGPSSTPSSAQPAPEAALPAQPSPDVAPPPLPSGQAQSEPSAAQERAAPAKAPPVSESERRRLRPARRTPKPVREPDSDLPPLRPR